MPGRGNGLQASSYAPLADLNPQLADAMLETLAEEGVAAYAAPAPESPEGGLAVTPFRGPLDRLWVDASAMARAQTVINTHLPELGGDLEYRPVDPRAGTREPKRESSTLDRAGDSSSDRDREKNLPGESTASEKITWEAIVASYNLTTDDPVPRWPVLEDVDERDETPRRRADKPLRPGEVGPEAQRRGNRPDSSAPEPPVSETGLGQPQDRPRDDDPEEHYIPPPPPPLPSTDTITKVAWAALLGGPVYLLVVALTGRVLEGWSLFLAGGAFVGGFVTLVARIRDRPEDGSGPDDGAVV